MILASYCLAKMLLTPMVVHSKLRLVCQPNFLIEFLPHQFPKQALRGSPRAWLCADTFH